MLVNILTICLVMWLALNKGKKRERRESTVDYLSPVKVKRIKVRQLAIAIQQGGVAVTPLVLIQYCLIKLF